MKIGILTFHWASNYGAVLQCYALQETLKAMGHEVSVINYKPRQYDDTLWTFLRYRKFLHFKQYLLTRKKDALINRFRIKHLSLSPRYYTSAELKNIEGYDAIISGSDQVLNLSFLKNGEPGGSKAYYLDFVKPKTKKVTYAVSFGTTIFPQNEADALKEIVAKYNAISVREQSGLSIFEQLGRCDAIVVPDPTLLLDTSKYLSVAGTAGQGCHTCLYMLRGRASYVKGIDSISFKTCDMGGIEEWIQGIYTAKNVITNSFHGTVFSILFNVPFMVVLTTKDNVGMNDRFFSLLSELDLLDRITTEKDCDYTILEKPINWSDVNARLKKYKRIGIDFLKEGLR